MGRVGGGWLLSGMSLSLFWHPWLLSPSASCFFFSCQNPFLTNSRMKKHDEGQRDDGSGLQRACCSCRIPEVSSYHVRWLSL